MTMQYEQQNINLEVETAFKSFIFDPSSPQSDVSYSDWIAMLGVLQSLPGVKEILIREGGITTVPAGTYDMTDIVISGETPLAALDVTDVQFQNLKSISNITMSTGGTAANTVSTLVYNDGNAHTIVLDKATLVTGAFAVAPFVDVSNATSLGVFAHGAALLSVNAGVPLFAVDATSSINTTFLGGSHGNNWGGGNGQPAFVVVAGGGTFTLSLDTGDIFWSADNPAGPTTVTRGDDYEAAVAGDWSGVQPLNVKNALDRIAAAIGPIA